MFVLIEVGFSINSVSANFLDSLSEKSISILVSSISSSALVPFSVSILILMLFEFLPLVWNVIK